MIVKNGWLYGCGILLFLMLGSSPGYAYRELFRADFNSLPAGVTAQADYGTMSSQAFAQVHYQSLFFPPGFVTNWMRIAPTGSFSQMWTLADQARSGECSLMWRMHLSAAMPIGQSLSISPLFRAVNNPTELPIVVDFRTDGAITVDAKPASATWSPGVVYQYTLTVDFSTGAYQLWQNTNRIASGHSAQTIRQRMTWTRVQLAASGTYPGTIDIDSVYALNGRPFVSYAWMDFELEPPLGILPLGLLGGYPQGDRIVNRQKDSSDTLDFADEAGSRRLRLRNDQATALRFQVTNDVGQLPDGRYRLSFDYRQTATNGNLTTRILDSSTAKTAFSFDDGFATLNSNLLTVMYPSASIALPSNQTIHVEIWTDTLADNHDLVINGSNKAEKWPNFGVGRPTVVEFTTAAAVTPVMYLDNVALERRGRESIIALSQTAPINRLSAFRPVSRVQDRDVLVSTNLVPFDFTYGPDGLLYVSDPINRRIAVFDPDHLTLMTSRTYEAWFHPFGLAPGSDGTILVMVQSNTTAAHVYSIAPYPDLSPGTGSRIANLSINTEQLEASADRSRLFVVKDSFPVASTVLVYSAFSYAKIGELAAVGMGGSIGRIHAGPDRSLYVTGTGTTRFAAIDMDHNTITFMVTATNTIGIPRDIGTLPNGDVLVVDNRDTVALFSHYHGELIATYRATLSGSPAFNRVIAAPEAAITSFARASNATMHFGVHTDYHRYLTVERATAIPGAWIPLFTNALTTNRTPMLSFINNGPPDMQLFRVVEAGWD